MDGHRWYAKYIAELATTSSHGTDNAPWFSLYSSPVMGRLVIVDAAIASVFLAAITLCISVILPLLLCRLPRAAAITWCALRDDPVSETSTGSDVSKIMGSWNLPVMLANSGMFLSDAMGSLFAAKRHLRQSEIARAAMYVAFTAFCLVSVLIGPLVALLVSRGVLYGFAGAESGPCLAQYNFTANASNFVAGGLNHHMRSYELLPWMARFNYSWEANNTDYAAGKSVVEPTSRVQYESIDECLLKDSLLCNWRFPRTHKVSVELSPSQMGLWYDETWSLQFNGYCLRLNSSSIFGQSKSRANVFGLDLAPGSRRINDTTCPYSQQTSGSWYLGQNERQRFDRRKNIITDSFFVNNDPEMGYSCYKWRDSLRSLEADSIMVVTALPPRDEINQNEDDELYLSPLSDSQFKNMPAQVAHILCWEELYVNTSARSFKTSADWADRSAAVEEHGLPKGLTALLDLASTEFLVKPARYLRGSSSLLQSIAETPAWEYNPANAPPVPFGAEVHRWAHIGALDIASKALRTATGFYGRGNKTALEEATTEGAVSDELLDLCSGVRRTSEGTIALSLSTLVGLAVLLAIALFWWVLERIGVALASWGIEGPWGIIRAFLMLPASTPTSLAVSAEMGGLLTKASGCDAAERVIGSASGQPYIKSIGSGGGPSLNPVSDNKWVLFWGFSGLHPAKNKTTKLQ